MKPILFNTEMVRAILEDRKTVTRRVVKDAGPDWDFVGIEERPCERRVKADGTEYPKELDWPHAVFSAGNGYYDYPMIKVPYRPGSILYVRETWAAWSRTMGTPPVLYYKADGNAPDGIKWRPSIHMPREAARIFLRVTDMRVEKLQNITKWQAADEGQPSCSGLTVCGGPSGCHLCEAASENSIKWFEGVWNSTINPAGRALYGWDANPYVWIIEFERCEKPEGE